MKIKIKKEGKVKQFKLISKWEDVTMEKWLKLMDFTEGTKSKEAEETIAALSDIPKELIKELSLKDVAVLMHRVSELQREPDSSLKRIIEINGKEYGFHPNLDDITLGEYADIETFIKNGIEDNLPEIMSILYRPVQEKGLNGVYTINAYDGNISIRAEEMRKMSADEVQGALVFFCLLGRELLKILPLYFKERLTEMQKQLALKTLRADGHGSE